MEIRIRATEAARTFSDLLSRAHYRGESFLVERGGEPVCRITPAGAAGRTVADLVRLLKAAARPDEQYLRFVERAVRRQPPLPKLSWPR